MNDYSAIFAQDEITPNVTGRFNRRNFDSNIALTSPERFLELSKTKPVWEMPFVQNEFDEDNDSGDEASEEDSEEEDEMKNYMTEMLKDIINTGASKKVINELKRGGGLKFFIYQEKKLLEARDEKE